MALWVSLWRCSEVARKAMRSRVGEVFLGNIAFGIGALVKKASPLFPAETPQVCGVRWLQALAFEWPRAFEIAH